jgi:uncharacterized membrane protein YeaQ/YmgE (transglycosylase-associated protein family)
MMQFPVLPPWWFFVGCAAIPYSAIGAVASAIAAGRNDRARRSELIVAGVVGGNLGGWLIMLPSCLSSAFRPENGFGAVLFATLVGAFVGGWIMSYVASRWGFARSLLYGTLFGAVVGGSILSFVASPWK